ncbi:hypothetical protein E4U40_007137 [Claviceps sp. LM458 group G5]|nr:hypothetical protein E4U40_007137 [Claviceps sp. LM458 group G5]
MSWHSRVHEIRLAATLQHQSECLIRSLVPITVVAHVARQVVRVKVVSTVQVRKRTYQLQAEISAVSDQAQFLSRMALQHVVDLDDTALRMTKASPAAIRRVQVVDWSENLAQGPGSQIMGGSYALVGAGLAGWRAGWRAGCLLVDGLLVDERIWADGGWAEERVRDA